MRKLIAFACACALAVCGFGFTTDSHTNSFVRAGVTYAQRGGMGAATFVVTNVEVRGNGRMLPKYLYALPLDYTYPDDAAWYYQNATGNGGHCSVRRNGDLVERNFDWKFDEAPTFVLPVTGGEGRFASVGVANVGTHLTDEMVRSGEWSRYYKCLAGHTVDGVNENGVFAEVNVTSGSWGRTSGEVHGLGAVRWALDHGTNAAQVAHWLADNIYLPEGFGENLHYLIADRSQTWIVENCAAHQITNAPAVMTNFNLDRQGGEGYERYDSLTNGATIQSQWWTKAYDRDTRPVRVSDLPEDRAQVWTAWESKDREAHRGESFGGVTWWQTVHCSIYDLQKLTLKIAVQENDDWYVFGCPSGGRVKSVNGKTGDVVLDAADVHALPETFTEADPTVKDWAKADTKPSYTPSEVGALPDNQAQLEANQNFRGAVAAVSPPVVLPTKWALNALTNSDGSAVYNSRTGYTFGSDSDSRYTPIVGFRQDYISLQSYDGSSFMLSPSGIEYSYDGSGEDAHIVWKDMLTTAEGDLRYDLLGSSVSALNSAKSYADGKDAQTLNSAKQYADGKFETKTDAGLGFKAATNYTDAVIAGHVATSIVNTARTQMLDAEGNHYASTKNWTGKPPSSTQTFLMEFNPTDGCWYCDDQPPLVLAMKLEYVENGYTLYAEAGGNWHYLGTTAGSPSSTSLTIAQFQFTATGSGALTKDKTVAWSTDLDRKRDTDDYMKHGLPTDGGWASLVFTVRSDIEIIEGEYTTSNGIVWMNDEETKITRSGTSFVLSDQFDEVVSSSWTDVPAKATITIGGTQFTFDVDGTYDRFAFVGDLSGYVPTSRKVNGQSLTQDITIEGMTDNALVLTNGAVKTKGGATVGAGAVGALSEAQTKSLVDGYVSSTNQPFCDAVLAVGLNIDTNSVAVLNEIAATFGGFPIAGTSTTIGGLLAALAAAVAMLNKRSMKYDAEKDRYYTER